MGLPQHQVEGMLSTPRGSLLLTRHALPDYLILKLLFPGRNKDRQERQGRWQRLLVHSSWAAVHKLGMLAQAGPLALSQP